MRRWQARRPKRRAKRARRGSLRSGIRPSVECGGGSSSSPRLIGWVPSQVRVAPNRCHAASLPEFALAVNAGQVGCLEYTRRAGRRRGTMRADSSRPRPLLDPRIYQITVLSGLLIYGLGWLHFDITPGRAALLLSTALLTQYVCTKLWRLPKFDPKSALISGLSLCLLLRTNFAALAILAAVVTIASKFLVRWKGKHIFNPTNIGLVFLMLLGAPIWVSPGQWGSVAYFGFLMACLGAFVVNRAAGSDGS